MATTERGCRSRAFGATPDRTCWRQSTPLVFLQEAKKFGVLGSVPCFAHLTLAFNLEANNRPRIPAPHADQWDSLYPVGLA